MGGLIFEPKMSHFQYGEKSHCFAYVKLLVNIKSHNKTVGKCKKSLYIFTWIKWVFTVDCMGTGSRTPKFHVKLKTQHITDKVRHMQKAT